MKRVLITLLIALPLVASAQWRHYRHQPQHIHQGGWIAPLVLGSAAGVIIIRETLPRQEAQTVVIPQPGVPPEPRCTEWREIETPEGTRYRERVCSQ